jgi:Uma2 family endonuclease
MADVATQGMTAPEFLVWCTRQEDERWELVRGVPVQIMPMEMMAGARWRHDMIVVNLLTALRDRLRGAGCRPHTADFSLLTAAGENVRRPDVLVDCGVAKPNDLAASVPSAVFEVLSPSNANFTRFAKVDEYKAVATLRHIVVLDSDAPRLVLYSRAANDAWTSETVEGESAELVLTGFGVTLPLSEIYADVLFGDASNSAG